MRLTIRFAAVVVLAALVSAIGVGTAAAQDGTVRGIVTDSAGKPIVDADVAIVALHQLARTDSAGRFTFTRLPRGTHELSVRRLGYAPETLPVTVNEMAYSYAVVLAAQPAVLAGMQISAEEQRLRLGIEDFYRRRARGAGGVFFTRDEIAARNARQTSDVFRSTPGVRIVRGRGVGGIRFTGSGSARRECTPVVWLDGQEAQNLEIDDIPVNDIEGIEVYTGPATTPMQFSQKQSHDACGTVVIWSRIPGRE